MFPVQRGLYDTRSTMNQFAKPGGHFMNFDQFPYSNANLTELSSGDKLSVTSQMFSSDKIFDQDLPRKEDESNIDLSSKKILSKAERRAEHNAIERARRESLNTKFQSLAQILPNLNNYRRPSKGQIVEKALDWVKQSLLREERYRYQILCLQRENKKILSQAMSQEQVHPLKQQNKNIPIPKQSESSPTNNSSISNNLSPVTNIYSSAFNTTNGWSNSCQFTDKSTQIYTLPSTGKLIQQDFRPKRDDEATINSTDEAEYRSSCNTSVFMDHDNYDRPIENQRQFTVPEICPTEISVSQAHFDPNLVNHWNYTKHPQDNMNGVNLDPGTSSRSASLQMFS